MEPHTLNKHQIRQMLQDALPSISDFDEFCLDNYPSVYNRFSGAMDRVQRTNILLEQVSSLYEIHALLRQRLSLWQHSLVSESSKQELKGIQLLRWLIPFGILLTISAGWILWKSVHNSSAALTSLVGDSVNLSVHTEHSDGNKAKSERRQNYPEQPEIRSKKTQKDKADLDSAVQLNINNSYGGQINIGRDLVIKKGTDHISTQSNLGE